jgi:hypothetical protein
MTEEEWERCGDTPKMLAFLGDRPSDRQFRLFACACCRRVWHLLPDPAMREAIELLERYADGLASRDEVALAFAYAWDNDPILYHAPAAAAGYAFYFARQRQTAEYTSGYAARVHDGESAAQARLLRCIVGNPFLPLAARTFPAHVIGLAETCYLELPEVGDPFPILADALAELGEEQAAAHCRESRHARGCHVIDWIRANSGPREETF